MGLRSREKNSMEEMKKMSKAQRELKEDLAAFQGKDADFGQKKVDMEKMLEVAEAETIIAKNELKVAQRRIEDLQAAIQGVMVNSLEVVTKEDIKTLKEGEEEKK